MVYFTSTNCILVALIDDDINFQIALKDAISKASDINLVSIASTKSEGLKILEGSQVDVLIVDLGLPDGSGIDIIIAAHDKWPECNLMVSTSFGDEFHVMNSMKAGATGYLLKDSAPKNLINEIVSLHSGGSPISPLIARKILSHFCGYKNKGAKPELMPTESQPESNSESQTGKLSKREQEVLEYITKGFSSNEIANLLYVSPHTVLTYIRRIYIKLNVKSKTEAIYEARFQGLIS